LKLPLRSTSSKPRISLALVSLEVLSSRFDLSQYSTDSAPMITLDQIAAKISDSQQTW
jgi:hypothetical protein